MRTSLESIADMYDPEVGRKNTEESRRADVILGVIAGTGSTERGYTAILGPGAVRGIKAAGGGPKE